jgi:hypothetical protein
LIHFYKRSVVFVRVRDCDAAVAAARLEAERWTDILARHAAAGMHRC